MTANGRSSRCLRARSVATAYSSSARHARWNPPMPLTATIAPPSSAGGRETASGRRRDRAAGAARAPRLAASTSVARGPHSGARVRLRVEAAVARVVVLGPAGRAHREARPSSCSGGRTGSPVTIVKRGPQSVQLMNG